MAFSLFSRSTRSVAASRFPLRQRRAPTQRLLATPPSATPGIRTKLKISAPNDRFEQEADRVAARVMQAPQPQIQERPVGSEEAPGVRIQRVCTGCEEELHRQPSEEDEERLEAKSIGGPAAEVSPRVASGIAALRGKGRPLPSPVRVFFEPRFGADFSGVRVHSDARAAEAARSVRARAFTVGRDIAFGATEYAPDTTPGRQLLAHELTHVLQQGGQRLRRQAIPGIDEDVVASQPGRSVRLPRWLLGQIDEDGKAVSRQTEGVLARKRAEEGAGRSLLSGVASSVVFRTPSGPAAGDCSWTCPPRGATPYVPVSNPSFNCYAYAMDSPGSLFLQPGQIAGTLEFRASTGDPAAVAALGGPPGAATHLLAHYYTPSGMRAQMTADLGSPSSPNCLGCCAGARRKVMAVTSGPLSAVGSSHWDFHWYRKDADRGWSHKRGTLDSQRDDAAGAGPICSPCRAARNYGAVNYNHVVGAWCV